MSNQVKPLGSFPFLRGDTMAEHLDHLQDLTIGELRALVKSRPIPPITPWFIPNSAKEAN